VIQGNRQIAVPEVPMPANLGAEINDLRAKFPKLANSEM
jgi:hypothetical protein